MRRGERKLGIRWRGQRRPLAGVFLAGLLFELCVLAGVIASPLLQDWMPRRQAGTEDPTLLFVRWRQSRYRREADPAVGEKAPPLTLRGQAGERLSLADLQGRKVALVFAQDGSG
jgi:hypothetical protein